MGKTARKVFLITAGTVAAWAAAIKPRTKGKPDMTVFSSYDYANGGLHDYCKNIPENSLESYRRALKHGYGVVMDVRITKDGVPVVFADHELWRMCAVDGYLEEKTLEELKELTLLEADCKIPTLEEALNLIDGQVPVLLQLKVEKNNYMELCVETSAVIAKYDGILAIESLDYRCVRWFMRCRPEVIRGQMLEKSIDIGDNFFDFITKFAKNWLLTNCLTKPDFISSCYMDRRSISLLFCRLLYRVPVMEWLICTRKEYETARLDDAMVIFEDIEP